MPGETQEAAVPGTGGAPAAAAAAELGDHPGCYPGSSFAGP